MNPTPAKRKVLVIDDESAVRSTLQRYLSLSGYEPMLAGSAQEGLKALEATTPDLILLDISMPDMDGMVTLQKLHEHHAGIQVIMLATANDTPKAHIALNCGAGDFISKPVDLATLKRTLQVHLR